MVEQGGLENGSPPAGSCTYKNWFLCIICLYVIAKTYAEIEKTYSYATRQAATATLEMMYPARGVWIGVR